MTFNDRRRERVVIVRLREITLIILLVGIGVLFFNTESYSEDDWQYWNAYSFKYKVNDDINLILSPSLRLDEDISQLFYWESWQGAEFKVNKHLDMNLHYLFARTKKQNNKWVDEHRIEFQPTFKWNVGDLKFSDRNRVEYRVVGGTEKWRYRNSIKLKKTITVKNKEYTPFIANEVFYDFSADRYNQNRTAVGFSQKISDIASLDIFYIYRMDKKGVDWQGVNVVGTAVKFSL